MRRTIACLFICLLSNISLAGELEEEIKLVKLALEKREQKRDKHQSTLKALNVKARELKDSEISIPKNEVIFNQLPLKCKAKHFTWKTTLNRENVKDCEFKYNILDPKQIRGFYSAIERLKAKGWEVAESKLYKQLRLSEKIIWNYEHYRFAKKQEGTK